MAWCPKCKNEYREGVTVCPDCGVELVDELPDDDEALDAPKPVIIMTTADRDVGEKIVKYLRYSGIISSALAAMGDADGMLESSDADESDDQKGESAYENTSNGVSSGDDYGIIVADLEEDAAIKLFPGLAKGESIDEDRLYELVPDIEDRFDELENEKASKEFSELRSEASTLYVKKRDKYADLKFSGYSFIGFGLLGVLIIVLNILHIINLFNTYSLIVMSLVFVVFFVIGFVSLYRAKQVKDSVAVEDEFTKELNEWIDGHLSDDVIDEWYDENKEDQENYFAIQERLSRMIQEQFPNIHPSYIEELAEDRYTSYLERSAYESPEDVPVADEDEEESDESDN